MATTFTNLELSLLAEALDARLETGDFEGAEDEAGEIVFCSPSHEAALTELADKVVNAQEAEQD
jgi:hypothetical protein